MTVLINQDVGLRKIESGDLVLALVFQDIHPLDLRESSPPRAYTPAPE